MLDDSAAELQQQRQQLQEALHRLQSAQTAVDAAAAHNTSEVNAWWTQLMSGLDAHNASVDSKIERLEEERDFLLHQFMIVSQQLKHHLEQARLVREAFTAPQLAAVLGLLGAQSGAPADVASVADQLNQVDLNHHQETSVKKEETDAYNGSSGSGEQKRSA